MKKRQEDAIASLIAVTKYEEKKQKDDEVRAQKKAEIDAQTAEIER